MHIPSTPLGWSAGKWGEWYPDVLQKDGSLGIERPKPYWPSGWWSQHQRILEMLHAQRRRMPLIVSGDLHALACGKIHKSGSLDFFEKSHPLPVRRPPGQRRPCIPVGHTRHAGTGSLATGCRRVGGATGEKRLYPD